MVEQIVFFALGFALCGLIGLALLPLVAARSRRLTLALMEQRLPMSFDEIDAERDALRAKFATENRALELAAQQARVDKAEFDAELGRRAVAEMRAKQALAETSAALATRDEELASALARAAGLDQHLAQARAAQAAGETQLEQIRRDLAQADAALDRANRENARLDDERAAAEARAQSLDDQLKAAEAFARATEAREAEREQRRGVDAESLSALRAAIDDLGLKIAHDGQIAASQEARNPTAH